MYQESTGHSRGPQRVARQVTMTPKSSYRPRGFVSAPQHSAPRYSAPAPHYSAPPPQMSTSSGQYKSGGGGGAPSAPPAAHQGRIGGVGNQGGGGGNNGGGGGGNRPAPRPHAPSIGQYLNSNPDYQSGVSELQKALQQYMVQNRSSRSDVKTAFQTAMERMGQERTKALQSLQEDFASRGLLTSGLYAQSVNDYNTDYTNRSTDLTNDENKQLKALLQEAQNTRSLNRSKMQELRLNAVRDRAAKYGIR